jgi:hypothetical protein
VYPESIEPLDLWYDGRQSTPSRRPHLPEPALNKLTELSKLRSLVAGAVLGPEAKHTALWCLDELPKLYAQLFRTDESRFWDAIGRMGQAVLKRMGEEGAGDDAGKVSDAVVRGLGGMHRRLGIAPLALKTKLFRPEALRRQRCGAVTSKS